MFKLIDRWQKPQLFRVGADDYDSNPNSINPIKLTASESYEEWNEGWNYQKELTSRRKFLKDCGQGDVIVFFPLPEAQIFEVVRKHSRTRPGEYKDNRGNVYKMRFPKSTVFKLNT